MENREFTKDYETIKKRHNMTDREMAEYFGIESIDMSEELDDPEKTESGENPPGVG